MTYRVEYKEYFAGDTQAIMVQAKNRAEAYDKAVFEELQGAPYSAWVESVTYANGKVKHFNNFEGKPY